MLKEITINEWEHVPAGKIVPDGYGGYKMAPQEDGFYTLYELADEHNYHTGWKWVKHEGSKDSMKKKSGLVFVPKLNGYNREDGEYYFVSKNGITYGLLEGMSIGSKKRYTSETVFIMLNIFDADDEFYQYWDDVILVNFVQMTGEEENCGLEESEIEEYVDEFETNNETLIDYILRHNITTVCWED